ncbi:MAG: hypothetical protein K2Y39_21545 [Candidatus Obscuribacterales bacterium]|nr:hypothetical protein [Candidatus Obscuribacterales bacterium]
MKGRALSITEQEQYFLWLYQVGDYRLECRLNNQKPWQVTVLRLGWRGCKLPKADPNIGEVSAVTEEAISAEERDARAEGK